MIRAATKLAVAYYRMSTDRQEASIPAQREAVQKYATENGYQITREYIDEGISGDATEKRKQFQRMIADAERGGFEAILCWDMDRFGRFDSIEAGRWVYPLRANQLRLATVAQGEIDWTDFAGRMMYGIQTEAKHQYLTDLSRNVTRGMTRLAEQGKWPGGPAPIGYVVKDKQLERGPAGAVALVRWLFAEYANGKSLRGLAAELNGQGWLSPKGKKWTANGIAGVLKNPAYVGDFVWNRRCESKYKRKVAGKKQNQESEWIVFADHHTALIERQQFDKVQSQLAARKNCSTPKISGGGFVLSGILVCGHCGHRMTGDTANRVHNYTCYGYRQHRREILRAKLRSAVGSAGSHPGSRGAGILQPRHARTLGGGMSAAVGSQRQRQRIRWPAKRTGGSRRQAGQSQAAAGRGRRRLAGRRAAADSAVEG